MSRSHSVNESTKADDVDTVDHCICGAVGGSATDGAFRVTAVAVPCMYPTKIRLPIKDTAMVAPFESELVKGYDYFMSTTTFFINEFRSFCLFIMLQIASTSGKRW